MFPCTQPGSKFLLAVLAGPVAVGVIKGAFDGDKDLLSQKIVDRRVIQVADVVSLNDTQSHTFGHQYIADFTITIPTNKFGQNEGFFW